MIAELQKRVSETDKQKSLQILYGDVIKTNLPYFDVCVANVPYNISSAIVFKLLVHRPLFRCAVLMFQEEFALRLSAKPGDELYCRLSVNTQLLAKVDQLMKVGRNNFRPPPKVESRVVRIEPRNPPPPVNFLEWDGLIRILFNRKNKTLRSVLTTTSVLDLIEKNYKTIASLKSMQLDSEWKAQEAVEQVLDKLEYRESRASKLNLDDFLKILTEMNANGIHFTA